jgi:nucleotide-binding universal stress UspA family protein
MFKHLLVPLDGSSLAEMALPYATYLASSLHASVTLIHIIEQNAPSSIHGEAHLRDEADARAYLSRVASQAFEPGCQVDSHVHTEKVRNVARSIADHAGEFAPDLIILCAHGEGGLRDIIVGSIAQQVIGRSKTPVLLLQPEQRMDIQPVFRRILVGLDGNPEHDLSLQPAVELALACGSALNLLTVVPTLDTLKGEQAASGMLMPHAAQEMLNISETSAMGFLQAQATALEIRGLQADIVVERGDPAQQIGSTAERLGVDLLTLGTHGRAGMGAFWSGSVASKVIGRTHIPLLLVPV